MPPLEEATAAFLKWLQSSGATWPRIDFPATHPEYGYRCAIARQDIESLTPLVSVPYSCMICAPSCLRDPTDETSAILRDLWISKSLQGDPLLCACISHQITIGPKSPFYPYLQFLLASDPPGTISKWDDDHLNELQNPALKASASLRVKDELSMYNRVKKIIDDHDSTRETSPFSGVSEAVFNFSWHLIQSRAFGRRLPWTALVPLADCFNHANLPVRYALSNLPGHGKVGGANGYTLDPPLESTFSLYPSGNNSYKLGAEVFNSYGRRNNDHLLLDYGFSILPNEHDRFHLRVTLPRGDSEDPEQARLFAARRNVLSDLGYGAVKTLRIQYDKLALDGILFFRVANLEHEIVESRPDASRPLNVETEIRAIAGFTALLAQRLSSHPTTLEQDEDTLEKQVWTGANHKSALQYRISRKRILTRQISLLDSIFAALSSRLSDPDSDVLPLPSIDTSADVAFKEYVKSMQDINR